MSVLQLKFPTVIALPLVSPLKSVSIYFIYLHAPNIGAPMLVDIIISSYCIILSIYNSLICPSLSSLF